VTVICLSLCLKRQGKHALRTSKKNKNSPTSPVRGKTKKGGGFVDKEELFPFCCHHGNGSLK
ncbi:MAG: hypothetical protein PHX91_03620, partial [Prevotella sp.]|nr:hypothetical protein [Prevotella sp.]